MLNYTSFNLRKVNVMDVLKLMLMPGSPISESADSDCLFMYCFPHAFWLSWLVFACFSQSVILSADNADSAWVCILQHADAY